MSINTNIVNLKIKTILAAAMLGFMSLPAYSTDTFVTLTEYELWSNTYNDSQIRILDLDGVSNPESCTDPDSYFIDPATSDVLENRIYSTLLAAKIGNQEVTVVLNSCWSNRPRIINVILE